MGLSQEHKLGEVAQRLLVEFGEELKQTDKAPDYASYLDKCPEEDRTELRSLMNVSVLAYRALADERETLRHQAERV